MLSLITVMYCLGDKLHQLFRPASGFRQGVISVFLYISQQVLIALNILKNEFIVIADKAMVVHNELGRAQSY